MTQLNLSVKEQIIKRVVKSGNGGAVWVPKDWMGQEVIVTLPNKPEPNIKERIIHLLEPYLRDIIAVFIYGSYARHEETKNSDIDVMAITKDKNISIEAKEPNLEVYIFQLGKLKKAIEKHPAMYYQIVQEAEPLINAYVLEELKNIKVGNENFKNYLIETKEHIESNEELLELDKLDGRYIKSYSAIYSTILRLRSAFITKCILTKEKFSNKAFEKWLMHNGISKREFEQCYAVYRLIKNEMDSANIKIKISVAEKLLNLLKKEIHLIESMLYGE